MGSCACLLHDTNSNNSHVDIFALNQKNNSVANMIPGEAVDVSLINPTKDKDKERNRIAQASQHQYSNVSNPAENTPIKAHKQEDTAYDDKKKTSINSVNGLYIPQKEKEMEKEKEDTQFAFSHRSISRFLNRTHINIVVLGGKGVGKSAFVIKYINNIFERMYIPTLGSEFRQKKVEFNSHSYTINFIVTAGNTYKSDYSKAYASVDFFLAFYDVTSLSSVEEVKTLLKSEVKGYLYSYGSSMKNILLVGNKIDEAQRKCPVGLVQKYCVKHNLQHFEISVKNNLNIAGMMKTILKKVDDNAYLPDL